MAAAKEGADTGDMIVLISSDGERFEVPMAVTSLSNEVSNMIEDDCTEDGVPLPNVTSSVLAKIVDYCKMHAAAVSSSETDGASSSSNAATTEATNVKEELKSFDTKFIDVDKTMLFDLLMPANFMNIKSLLDLATQRVADLLRGKSPEQIRKEFNIKNDFTPEEEAAIGWENQWAFQD